MMINQQPSKNRDTSNGGWLGLAWVSWLGVPRVVCQSGHVYTIICFEKLGLTGSKADDVIGRSCFLSMRSLDYFLSV